MPLMPFGALKRAKAITICTAFTPVEMPLMPFGALKRENAISSRTLMPGRNAPNALRGTETKPFTVQKHHVLDRVEMPLMPFGALKPTGCNWLATPWAWATGGLSTMATSVCLRSNARRRYVVARHGKAGRGEAGRGKGSSKRKGARKYGTD